MKPHQFLPQIVAKITGHELEVTKDDKETCLQVGDKSVSGETAIAQHLARDANILNEGSVFQQA